VCIRVLWGDTRMGVDVCTDKLLLFFFPSFSLVVIGRCLSCHSQPSSSASCQLSKGDIICRKGRYLDRGETTRMLIMHPAKWKKQRKVVFLLRLAPLREAIPGRRGSPYQRALDCGRVCDRRQALLCAAKLNPTHPTILLSCRVESQKRGTAISQPVARKPEGRRCGTSP
jgi:hypothetical protein